MTAGRPLVVVGDTLCDVDLVGSAQRLAPDAAAPVIRNARRRERPGGAGLAALLAARAAPRASVALVTALGRDEQGRRIGERLAAAGVTVIDLGASVTVEKVRVIAAGRMLARLDRDDGSPPGREAPAARVQEARAAIAAAPAVLASDYGGGVCDLGWLRTAVAEAARSRPVVWDPHPRSGPPAPGCWLVTPNVSEAVLLARLPDVDGSARSMCRVASSARTLRARWGARAVCVTMGPDGALLTVDDVSPPLVVSAPQAVGDSCGAGDAFAASAARRLATGCVLSEAVEAAVAEASAYVSAGGPLVVEADEVGAADEADGRLPAGWSTGGSAGGDGGSSRAEARARALRISRTTRARGEAVVAAGGCFDVLHAGHVQLLEAARQLGGCLVVLLNSDESVRRRKGPRRPVVAEADRIAVLQALASVDAVLPFDEDTPDAALSVLRPDVFVKGADYAAGELPEDATLRSWGGQAVVVPYRPALSTTSIIERIAAAHD